MITFFKNESDTFLNTLRSKEGKEWAKDLESFALGGLNGEMVCGKEILATRPMQQKPVKAGYLIVYSNNRKFARLHRLDDYCCPWTRTQVKDCAEVFQVKADMYDARCKICWPECTADSDESVSEHSD